MKLRTNPARVRVALAYYDLHGFRPTMRKFNLSSRSLTRWVAARAENGPDWPTLDMDREWLATRDHRDHRAANLRRWRARSYINRGSLLVDSTGTARRIRALMAIGWTAAGIAAHGPWATGDALLELAKRQRIHIDNRNEVARIYDDLCMTPGPSANTRRRALAKGWAPPLAWDDIDDPAETPDVPEVRQMLGRTKEQREADDAALRAARIENLRWMAANGESLEFAARRLGVTAGAIEKFLKYHGELDLLAEFLPPDDEAVSA